MAQCTICIITNCICIKMCCEGYCFKKFQKFLPFLGQVHRVLKYDKHIADQVKHLKIGDEIYFGGFTSTTRGFPEPQYVEEKVNFTLDINND